MAIYLRFGDRGASCRRFTGLASVAESRTPGKRPRLRHHRPDRPDHRPSDVPGFGRPHRLSEGPLPRGADAGAAARVLHRVRLGKRPTPDLITMQGPLLNRYGPP